jgi:hypothetical protein
VIDGDRFHQKRRDVRLIDSAEARAWIKVKSPECPVMMRIVDDGVVTMDALWTYGKQ